MKKLIPLLFIFFSPFLYAGGHVWFINVCGDDLLMVGKYQGNDIAVAFRQAPDSMQRQFAPWNNRSRDFFRKFLLFSLAYGEQKACRRLKVSCLRVRIKNYQGHCPNKV